jgi:hypothetical protein
MFTWECPKCGREIDIAKTACPNCDPGEPAPSDLRQPTSVPLPSPEKELADLVRSVPVEKPRQAFTLTPRQWLIFAFALVAAVGLAVYLAEPELFGFDRLQTQVQGWFQSEPAEAPGIPSVDPVEVAGLRLWRQDDKLKLRAVLVNHSDLTQKRVVLELRLYDIDRKPVIDPKTERALDPEPFAAFIVSLQDELPSLESREVQAEIEAAPAADAPALPRWDRIRAEVIRR